MPEAEKLIANGRSIVARQAEALMALPDQLDRQFAELVERILACSGKVVTTGVGTSGIMAERLAHLLAVSGTPAFYLPCLDALHGGIGAVDAEDVIIAFSKGGQSQELNQLSQRFVDRGVRLYAVTERPDSPFAHAATSVVTVRTLPTEADLGGLIATGSTLVFGAWGDALVGTLMAAREQNWEDVLHVHPGGVVGQQDSLPKPFSLDDPAGRP